MNDIQGNKKQATKYKSVNEKPSLQEGMRRWLPARAHHRAVGTAKESHAVL
jgi:hypothetical protein